MQITKRAAGAATHLMRRCANESIVLVIQFILAQKTTPRHPRTSLIVNEILNTNVATSSLQKYYHLEVPSPTHP
jgi:hypothetical protein